MTTLVAKRSRERRRAVVAAAVRDDDLVAAAAQRRERPEAGADPSRLVQRRNDDESFITETGFYFRASLSAQSYSRKSSGALPCAIAFCAAGSSASTFA